MNPSIRCAARLALVVIAGASMTACASRPKPMGPVAPTPPVAPPPPGAYNQHGVPPPGAVSESSESGAAVPGSTRDFVINAGDRVYFDFDSYTLRDDARSVLDAQAAWLTRYPGVAVRIEGNCDELGTREYNFALGARRANSVRDYLVGRGVSASRIETVSYGKEHPIDLNGGEAAQAHNRNAHTTPTSGTR